MIVEIKGTGQKVQFPDGMSQEEMLQALRRQWPSTSYTNALNMTTQGFAEPVEQTLEDKIKQGVADFLFNNGIISDRYGAQRIGENIAMGAGALPVIGDLLGGDELGRALRDGDATGIGLGALAAVPVVGDAAKNMRKVYHTSPDVINKIHNKGTFGANLFFSNEPYFMTASKNAKVYEMLIDEDKIVEAKRIPFLNLNENEENSYKAAIKRAAELLGTDDLDLAEDILTERETIYNNLDSLNLDESELGETDWYLQRILGDLGNALGFDAVSATDEQGEVLIANMLGKENRLIISDD